MGIIELQDKLILLKLMSQQRKQNPKTKLLIELLLESESIEKDIPPLAVAEVEDLGKTRQVSSGKIMNGNLVVDTKKETKWVSFIGPVTLAIITTIIGVELIYKPQIFNSAVTLVNSEKNGDRNTGITILKEFFEDRNPIRVITTFKTSEQRELEIIEILTTSIKTHYKAPKPLNISDPVREGKHKVGPDLQNALDIISGVKSPRTDSSHKQIKLDDSNLYNAQLEGAKLSNAIFNRSYLYLVNLKNAKLMNSHFNGAYLRGSDLTDAILTNADLMNADLHSTIMIRAKFTNEQIIKSCYWALAKYDTERSNTLPQRSSDNSISRTECNKDIVQKSKAFKGQVRKFHHRNISSGVKLNKLKKYSSSTKVKVRKKK